jgi:hypothetical protein
MDENVVVQPGFPFFSSGFLVFQSVPHSNSKMGVPHSNSKTFFLVKIIHLKKNAKICTCVFASSAG